MELENLQTVTIPNSVTAISQRAFWGCSALETIKIPASVDSIGNNCFDLSGLTKITFLGNSISSVGNAFSNSNATTANVYVSEGFTVGETKFRILKDFSANSK